MELIIGADIVPTATNISIFSNSKMEQIVDKKLFDILKSADYRIFDLECVLCSNPQYINKCGPHLVVPPQVVNGLKQLDVNLCTLANNHILDGGENGLENTINTLRENHIDFIGVGKNLSDSANAYILNTGGDCPKILGGRGRL